MYIYPHYTRVHTALREIPDLTFKTTFSAWLNISLQIRTPHTVSPNPYSFYWIEFQNCLHNYCCLGMVCIHLMRFICCNLPISTYDYHCFVQSKFYLMEFRMVVGPITFYSANNWDVTNILYGVSAEKRKMWIISVNLLHNIQLRWTFAIKFEIVLHGYARKSVLGVVGEYFKWKIKGIINFVLCSFHVERNNSAHNKLASDLMEIIELETEFV